jgi:hypothetical protein
MLSTDTLPESTVRPRKPGTVRAAVVVLVAVPLLGAPATWNWFRR